MSKVPYTITGRSISLLLDNRPRIMDITSPNFDALAAELRKPVHNLDLIRDLADISSFVSRISHGDIQIGDDSVRFKGVKVHNVVADRLIEIAKGGHDTEPMSRFLERLLQNPLESAQSELFLWLEAGNAPITPDGYFLAYKKVREDYTDCHTGKFDNSVGQKPEMKREDVDPDRNNECSRGLHFCSWGYLSHFSGTHVMIVQVDPADVVAIPNDYNRQKGRTWTYEVIGEVPQEEAEKFFENTPIVEVVRAEPKLAPEPVPDVVILGPRLAFNEVSVGDDVVLAAFDEQWLKPSDAVQLGSEGAVLEVDESDNTIRVEFADGRERWAPAESFVLRDSVIENDAGQNDELLIEGDEDDGENTIEEDLPEDLPVPEQTAGKAELLFQREGRSYLAREVLSLVKEHGQRGFNRLTGVPRSTLQLWLEKIAAQAEG